MTFIGVRVTGPTAEIVADSVSYTYRGTKFHEMSKIRTFPHRDAAMTTYGDGAFSRVATEAAIHASERTLSFDEWVDHAPDWLVPAAEAARDYPQTDSLIPTYGCAILVGRSEREGAFVAYRITSEDLRLEPLEDTFIHPSPFRTRPHPAELEKIAAADYGDPRVGPVIDQLVHTWSRNPAPIVNGTAESWINLVSLAREERSLNGVFLRCWIAGSIFITRLEANSIRTTRVHTFNDTGEELRRLVAGSRHPVGQISACGYCDSGKPFLDCCLVDQLEDDCECLSGNTFGDCCMVTDRDAVPDQLWTPHQRGQAQL